MHTVKVRDINMYYEINGQGEPLFLIQGLGGDLTGWMFQIPEFSKKYQVVAFDNRGVGRTEAPDAPYSIEMMADDMVGLMDSLGIDRAHILGLSMGGCIGQEFAIKYPGRLKTLILAASVAAPATYARGLHMTSTWPQAMKEGISPRTYARLLLPHLVTDKVFEDAAMLQMALDVLSACAAAQPAYAYSRQATAYLEHDARARLGQIRAPTLVLVGREDTALPVKLSEELAALIPNAKLVVLEGGGHIFNGEIPDKFNQAVLEFLARVP